MGEGQVEGTKERLFLAGVKVFARTGYKGATVREICQIAGAANINAINYYFGGKEKLYKMILDVIFSSYQKRKEQQGNKSRQLTRPEDRLRSYIESYCSILYSEGDVAREMTSIFVGEMSRPSQYLDDVVKKYMIPETEEVTGIVRDLLGPKTHKQVVLDCAVSIIGQITYYSYAWPMFSRAVPDHPQLEHYRTSLVDHVYQFSLAGLAAVKKSLTSCNRVASSNKKLKISRA